MNTITKNRAPNTLMLPRDLRPNKKSFESVGFTFEDVGDDVLYQATLPEGWKLEQTSPYWNNLIDEKDRKRGYSFYENVLERTGRMSLSRRFIISAVFTNSEDPQSSITVSVKDFNGTIVFPAGECNEFFTPEYETLIQKCTQFLESNYPEWKDPDKYWD